jgi:Domain of unknown function (DUF4389)
MSETPDQGDYQSGHQPPTPPESGDQSGGPSWGQQSADTGFGQHDPYGQGAGFGQQAAYGQGTPYGQQAAYSQGTPYGQPLADLTTDPSPVLVSFGPAEKQNRLTVAFRGIMAIPATFVLFFVAIAAGVVAFLGWWAALFTGKLPTWAFDFLTGFVRWTARVHAYSSLLTDRYPPFSLDDDPSYPVRLVSRPTRLNRAAVFFRVILVIPAGIVAGVAAFGMGILGFFGWLIALFTGKLPDSLHETFTTIVRYYVRYLGYYLMITPEYPAGLYGDQTATTAASAPAWEVPAADTVVGGSVFGDAGAADTGPITGFGGPAAPAATAPWQLMLSSTARTLVTVAIVVGAIGYGVDGYVTSQTLGNAVNTGNRVVADNAVTNAYDKLASVLTGFQGKTQNCQQNLACVTDLDSQVASAFGSFGQSLANADVPSDFSADVAALTTDNHKVQGDFSQLAATKSASQYTSVASGLSLQPDLGAWQGAFNKLHAELDKP